ncbi:hypothetical protein H0H93_005583, partial [Arthromyces matolae]
TTSSPPPPPPPPPPSPSPLQAPPPPPVPAPHRPLSAPKLFVDHAEELSITGSKVTNPDVSHLGVPQELPHPVKYHLPFSSTNRPAEPGAPPSYPVIDPKDLRKSSVASGPTEEERNAALMASEIGKKNPSIFSTVLKFQADHPELSSKARKNR